MNKSENIAELAVALSKFQGEMETVGFDANNPFFKSKYATLAQLVDCSRKLLSKHGLSVSQMLEGDGEVETILMHNSGQWISSKVKITPAKIDPQGIGSAITYARRYSYASALGLVSDDDDDGNAATHEKRVHTFRGDPIAPPMPKELTLRGMLEKIAIEKFGGLDKFQEWRINNDLPDSLEGLKDFDLARIMTKVREFKK